MKSRLFLRILSLCLLFLPLVCLASACTPAEEIVVVEPEPEPEPDPEPDPTPDPDPDPTPDPTPDPEPDPDPTPDPEPDPDDGVTVLWEGEAYLSWTDQSGKIFIGAEAFAEALPGDRLLLEYDQIDQTWGQAQLNYGTWVQISDFPEFSGSLVPTDLYGWTFGSCETYATLTDGILSGLQTKSGLIIQGSDLIFHKISLVAGPGYYEPETDPDPQKGNEKMHIFLAFGQSNMEGQARIESVDREGITNRFLMMAAVDFSSPSRVKGQWYKATPPLCRAGNGLCPCDWFGRTLVDALPEDHSVGIINVAVAGCSIDAFIDERVDTYLGTVESWLKTTMGYYGNRPYDRLVEIAKIAQEYGTVEGILVHQGESNTGDSAWPSNLNLVYTRLLTDLGLSAQDVPLLVGEVVASDQGGTCSAMNKIIDKINDTIPTAWPISATGCTCASDHIHFDAAGYREIGRRYAAKMLELKGW